MTQDLLLGCEDIGEDCANGLVCNLSEHFGATVQQFDETLSLLQELVGNLLEIVLHRLSHYLDRLSCLLSLSRSEVQYLGTFILKSLPELSEEHRVS